MRFDMVTTKKRFAIVFIVLGALLAMLGGAGFTESMFYLHNRHSLTTQSIIAAVIGIVAIALGNIIWQHVKRGARQHE